MIYRQNPVHLLNSFIYKDWDFINHTRKYITDIITTIFKDRQYAENVANATHELIENAYKYSPKHSDFNINIQEIGNAVILQVKNYPIGNIDEVYTLIKSELKKVYSIADPKEAYKMKILESLKDDKHSRLGFIKIRMETGAKIKVDKTDDGLIVISANFPRDHKISAIKTDM
ncbi:MAG: hypothetical protein JW969_16700 [Spirochaetales bacterium]|nr:hypothetical protein [Spirochaetales bacterium]